MDFKSQPQTYREKAPTRTVKPHYVIDELIRQQLAAGRVQLGDVGIADDGCKLLEEKGGNHAVLMVDVRSNRITSDGLCSLVRVLEKCINLEELHLQWNDLENNDGRGLDMLAEYIGRSNVRYVDISNCNMSLNSKNVVCALAAAPALRYLNVSWNTFNDSITPALLAALSRRTAGIVLELKGCGLSNAASQQVADAVKALGVRYPNVQGMKVDSKELLQDVNGKKMLLMDNVYNNEMLKKMSYDTSRAVLNPDTAELEILMSEMIKKKLLAKDRLLGELDEKVKQLHDVDVSTQELVVRRDKAANENMMLRRELEAAKTAYSKTKQSQLIEQENLMSQLKNMENTSNKRDIEHRSLVDRLMHEHRMQAKQYADQLEAKDMHLLERIKSMTMDKEKLERDASNLKEKLVSFMNNFTPELMRRREQAKQEERARAEWTVRLLESRLLSAQEGSDMSKRRAGDELQAYERTEDVLMQRVERMRDAISGKRGVMRGLEDAIDAVSKNNSRLADDDKKLQDDVIKLQLQAKEAADKLQTLRAAAVDDVKDANDDVHDDVARRLKNERVKLLEDKLVQLRMDMKAVDNKHELLLQSVASSVNNSIHTTLLSN